MQNQVVLSNVPRMTIHVGADKEPRTVPPGFICGVHYHEEIELLIVKKGIFCVTVDGKTYEASAGDVVFINSGVPHATHSIETPLQTGIIQFKESDFVDAENSQIINYSSKLKSISEVAVAVISDAGFFGATVKLVDEAIEQNTAYDMFVRSEIYEILGFLYRNKYLIDADDIKNNSAAQKILPVLSHINTNYHDNITLEGASEMLNFDPSYFCRIFKRATGATFTEYINFVRVCKAERMLARSDVSILDISEAVGFSSVSYFNRIFKKYKSCSPRFYRSAKYGENFS